jgi:hypothetical protein
MDKVSDTNGEKHQQKLKKQKSQFTLRAQYKHKVYKCKATFRIKVKKLDCLTIKNLGTRKKSTNFMVRQAHHHVSFKIIQSCIFFDYFSP